MLLAIDAGNTNTVFAVLEEREIICKWRCATDSDRTGDEYFVWLSALFGKPGIQAEIRHVVVACVVPRVLFNLKQLCERYFNCSPLVVGAPQCRLPVPARVDEGTNVGADRLVNTAAAFDLYGGNLIVVDFGTATTFDVVDRDGSYVGGAIAPGIDLSLKALHDAAAALPHVDIARPERVIGTNTQDCMHSGIYWGYVGLIQGICERIQAERIQAMKVIGTGGLASFFAKQDGLFDHVNTDLTIHGLEVVLRANRS